MDHRQKWKMQDYKTLRRYHSVKCNDRGPADNFLDTAPEAKSEKERIDELDFLKIKNFCCVKDTVKRIRRQNTDWEKIFAKDRPDK